MNIAMISVSGELKFSATREAFKLVNNNISGQKRFQYLLQGAIGTNEQEGSLLHDFDQLASNIPILGRGIDVQSLGESSAFGTGIHRT